jgi:hypothetical protein
MRSYEAEETLTDVEPTPNYEHHFCKYSLLPLKSLL